MSRILDLSKGWQVVRHDGTERFAANAPFDIHSRLYAGGLISDPYWRDTETSLDWVHESEWIATREFRWDGSSGHTTLTIADVDGIATIVLNGEEVERVESRFVRYDLDVSDFLRHGANTLTVHFLSASRIAAERAAALPFPVPYVEWNCRILHVNLLRRAQCDAGWDWNIALMPIGLLGQIELRRTEVARLDDLRVVQHHENVGTVRVVATAFLSAVNRGDVSLRGLLTGPDGASLEARTSVRIEPNGTKTNEREATLVFDVPEPQLWWPAGHGAQPTYELLIECEDQTIRRRIGLRRLELVSEPDETGRSFGFRVNGRDLFVTGANWVPADALPERRTPKAVRGILQSAVDAGMTMIRVWGGGVYEPDWFYDLCDELGLMVWQDFMFACHQFPSHDENWLALVRLEARQQLRRLSGHACMALWCGDNEGVPALDWWPVTRENRERYLALYLRLNETLRLEHQASGTDVAFWLSSPSRGPFDLDHDWYRDDAGDAHFWAVWHGEGEEAGRFDEFRRVSPRFCSEFGFQSFPSMPCIKRFTEPKDRKHDSPVMEVHQRNEGGNAKILDTMARYFTVPEAFDGRVFLSQVQQAMAIRTAVEHWRASWPRSRGTLYWQLNDTWPVASWSSLDHGGAWKVLHYAMRRAHTPVLVTAVPHSGGNGIALVGTSTRATATTIEVEAHAVALDGRSRSLGEWSLAVPPDRAVEIVRVPQRDLADGEFLHFSWTENGLCHESEFVPYLFRDYPLPNATIEARWSEVDGHPTITLTTDAVAHFVTIGLGQDAIWSDNAFTLLPDRPKAISAYRTAGGRDPRHIDRNAMTVQHLDAT